MGASSSPPSVRESPLVEQLTKRASDLKVPDDYVVLEQNPDGTILLGPDTSWAAIKRRNGLEDLSPEEFDAAFGELPTDDEG